MTENPENAPSSRRPDDTPAAPSFDSPTAPEPAGASQPPSAPEPPPSAPSDPTAPPSFDDATARVPSEPPPAPPAPPPPPPSAPSSPAPGGAVPPSGAVPPGPPGPPPGGYPPPPPPPGSYPPPAYPPPGGYGAPAAVGYGGASTTDEKTWILVAHFGAAAGVFLSAGLLGWVAPLVAMLAEGPKSATVRAHAVEALNFQITWAVICLIGGTITCGFGFIVLWIVPLIFALIAGSKANSGEAYQYPASIRLIK